MKRLLLLCFISVLLSACSSPGEIYPQMTAFYQYAEYGAEIIDCVVIPDSAYGIVRVVQYTQEEETGCGFDFLSASGKPESVGTLTAPAERELWCMWEMTP